MRLRVLIGPMALQGCALFAPAPPPAAAPPAAATPSPEARAAYQRAAEAGRRHAVRQVAVEVHGARAAAVPRAADVPRLPVAQDQPVQTRLRDANEDTND